MDSPNSPADVPSPRQKIKQAQKFKTVEAFKQFDVNVFLEAITEYSFLYDMSQSDYCNRDKRQTAYSQLALRFGFKSSEL